MPRRNAWAMSRFEIGFSSRNRSHSVSSASERCSMSSARFSMASWRTFSGISSDSTMSILECQPYFSSISAINIPLYSSIVDRLHSNQIYHTVQFTLASYRNLNSSSVHSQLCSKLTNDSERISTCSIHLINKCKSRDIVPTHLSVDRYCLTLAISSSLA